MTATLEKPITAFQIKRIMQNCSYQVEIKNEWVQWVTGDVNRTSLKSITHDQAVKIMLAQTGSTLLSEAKENWGYFDNQNSQHRYITVLLRNADIVVKSNKWGEVADMEGWFSKFLQSNRCPVKKPLKKMTPREVSKIITALEGVALWKNSI
ncbi:hypothetical protein ABF179_002404 [Flavobacterium psychrophilum]|uniref:hypothetical protein n=1 Tax=Flavobacterium psychrophilum TaxID=96345 RepID=UPI00061877AD|nr:hypothetical protein [Flavobacterium psychrophilum]ELY1979212.1 hypothetical protein [Flavobacterium psychrophilum]OAE90328.1 hypothetical protein SU65_11315 [Flavobacterium psychrophilum]OUD28820.1 hypothetical protein FPG92_01360 [Flavobacterium psychrophilum]